MINHFNEYVNLGWKVIPIYPKSKVPMYANWNKNYNVEKARKLIIEYPDCNLGLLLGQIVDVEGDTSEANELINKLTSHIKHPRFKSNKSIHHLFLNPYKDLTIYKMNGIEFRAHKHQSIIPPSKHLCGLNYEWLNLGNVPLLPKTLRKYLNKKFGNKLKTHNHIWCSVCNKEFVINKTRLSVELQAFKQLSLQWECKNCREININKLLRFLKIV